MEFNDEIRPINLPNIDDDDVGDDTLCTISGWGSTLNSSESGDYLRAALVPIVNQDSCKASYETKGTITERMICAGLKQGGKDGKFNSCISIFDCFKQPISDDWSIFNVFGVVGGKIDSQHVPAIRVAHYHV